MTLEILNNSLHSWFTVLVCPYIPGLTLDWITNTAQILQFASILQYLWPMYIYFSCSQILVITLTLQKAHARIYKHKINCVGFLQSQFSFFYFAFLYNTSKTATVFMLVLNKMNTFQKAKKTTTATHDQEKANVLFAVTITGRYMTIRSNALS